VEGQKDEKDFKPELGARMKKESQKLHKIYFFAPKYEGKTATLGLN